MQLSGSLSNPALWNRLLVSPQISSVDELRWPPQMGAVTDLGFVQEAEDGVGIGVGAHHDGVGGHSRQVALGVLGDLSS